MQGQCGQEFYSIRLYSETQLLKHICFFEIWVGLGAGLGRVWGGLGQEFSLQPFEGAVRPGILIYSFVWRNTDFELHFFLKFGSGLGRAWGGFGASLGRFGAGIFITALLRGSVARNSLLFVFLNENEGFHFFIFFEKFGAGLGRVWEFGAGGEFFQSTKA